VTDYGLNAIVGAWQQTTTDVPGKDPGQLEQITAAVDKAMADPAGTRVLVAEVPVSSMDDPAFAEAIDGMVVKVVGE
jgi:hypothetical protein